MKNMVLLGVVMLALFAGITIGQAGGDSQKLHRLEIVDQGGALRAVIGTKDDCSAFIHLYDEDGRVIWEAPPRVKLVPVED